MTTQFRILMRVQQDSFGDEWTSFWASSQSPIIWETEKNKSHWWGPRIALRILERAMEEFPDRSTHRFYLEPVVLIPSDVNDIPD